MAVTVPPDGWFRRIARALFDRYRQALVDLGIAVLDVPVDAFLTPDAARIPGVIDELRAFRPECVFGLPLGSYALLCRLPPGRDGFRPNVFLDVLEIPTICLWDHAPVELADQLLGPHPPEPASSTPGAREALGRVLSHPRLIHWSRDSGQTRIMRELGYLLPNRLIDEKPPVLPGFESSSSSAGFRSSVGFVGHVYQEPPTHPNDSLAALALESIRRWTDSTEPALWDVLRREIALMPEAERQQSALGLDDTYFWHFAHQLICHQGQTALRLKLLGGAGVPVACHGNLRTDQPGVPTNLVPVPSNVPYGPELAALFAHHAITIDVLSPGFISGYSHKQVHGFASGGFMLMNRKQDFVDAFGDAGEAVSCVGADEVGARVDRFLSRPKERLEVGDAIRDTIRTRFQLKDVLVRALHLAAECMASMGSTTTATHASTGPRVGTDVVSLRAKTHTKPQWGGASVQHGDPTLVSTASQPWAFAAAIPVPAIAHTMREPHVRITLMVDAGRVGIALLRDGTGMLLSEQFVSPTAQPVTLVVELPHEGARKIILRNTADTVSRARIFDATLCDRS